MNWKRFSFLFLIFILIPISNYAYDISTEGQILSQKLDGMEVDKHWLPSKEPLDWKTGDPLEQRKPSTSLMTHCSGFVAAACMRLNIYILRPPDHSYGYLANAQNDWLISQGEQNGWSQITSLLEVQQFANQGNLIVAVCRNPKPNSHGHIAIVRPSTKRESLILEEGPDIIQAGARNHVCTSLKQGFKYHPNELRENKVLFFAHKINWENEKTYHP